MEAIKWTLIVFAVINMLVNIALIDKPRKPITKATAAVTVVAELLWIWWIYIIL